MPSTRLLLAAMAAAGFTFSGAAFAQAKPDSAATCVACHGESGAAPIMPSYPVLAGQHATYLEHSLHAYKTGERKNAIMSGIVAGLSDADMRALSLYFAAQEGPLYVPRLP